MKFQNLTLIITLIGILSIIFISQNQPEQTATIEYIHQTKYKTTIKLQNTPIELIIFNTPHINLTKNDKIRFQGKPSTYKNKKQIIISKIKKIIPKLDTLS